MEVIPKQLGVVVRHFFEVGDEPAFVNRVTVEAARKLVADAASSHFLQGSFDHGEETVFFGLLVAFEEEIDGRSVGELRRPAEAAISAVEKLCDGLDLRVDRTEVKFRASTGEALGLRHGFGKRIRGAFKLGSAVAIGLRNSEEHAAKAGAAHLVFGRKIGPPEKRFAVGKQKAGERPAALPGNGADGGLI